MPTRQEGSVGGLYKQGQAAFEKNSLAPICVPRHYLKFHKCEDGKENWRSQEPEEVWLNPEAEIPWWKALNTAMKLA